MTRFINVCIVLMAVVGIIITQGPINISAEDEVSDDCRKAMADPIVAHPCLKVGLNDLATNQAQLCNAPADSGPGRLCSSEQTYTALKYLENGCDREIRASEEIATRLYTEWLTNIPRCEATCRQPSLLERCYRNDESLGRSSLENELCDKCELHYIKSWTGWLNDQTTNYAKNISATIKLKYKKRYDECVKITAPNNTSENDKLNFLLPNSHPSSANSIGSLVVVVVVALLFNI